MPIDLAAHYGVTGDPAAAIRAALERAGLDIHKLDERTLGAVDEFHIRGRKATLELTARLGLARDAKVLDIGSGLGGPARTVALTHACHVTGIDLTPSFVATAATLSGWTGLGHRTRFVEGDATALPFEDRSFDAAYTFHVAMNVPGKAKMYSEAHRVLKPGGRFLVYDVMQGPGGLIHYPTPWAQTAQASHVETPDRVVEMLTAAGFRIGGREDSSAESLAWFEQSFEQLESTSPPVLSIGTFMGPQFQQMAQNQIRNLREGRIVTVAVFCTA